jgi:hypothetical protein
VCSSDLVTGVLWCGDVGQDTWEEVDIIHKGLNYGWPVMEGFVCNPIAPQCDTAGYTLPIAVFGHNLGNAIVGGYVYRGSRVPWLTGAYTYSDYGSGKIWMLRYENGVVTSDSMIIDGSEGAISSFGTDQLNELYMVGYSSGSSLIFRFAGPGPASGITTLPRQAYTFRLDQNYPNPFNPSTVIGYQVGTTDHVTLRVYDVLGQEMTTLVDDVRSPGTYRVTLDAGRFSSGVYYYRLQAGGFVSTRRLIVVR